MAVDQDVVEYETSTATAGVPIDVDIQLYSTDTVQVTYGLARLIATPGVHYSVALGAPPSYRPFTVTPTPALITLMNAQAALPDEDYILAIRRELPLITAFTETLATYREQIQLEFDRTMMIFQQHKDWLLRTLYRDPGQIVYNGRDFRITNIIDGINDDDAATIGQVRELLDAAQVPPGALAPWRVVRVESSEIVQTTADDNQTRYLCDDSTDDCAIILPPLATLSALPDRWSIRVMSIGTSTNKETNVLIGDDTSTINRILLNLKIPRYAEVEIYADAFGFWATVPGTFYDGLTVGGIVNPNRVFTVDSTGFVNDRIDNNGLVGFYRSQNFDIRAAGQGGKRAYEFGAAGVFGQVAAREDVVATDTWALAANRSVEIKRFVTSANVERNFEHVRPIGDITWPQQQAVRAHRIAPLANQTGNNATVTVLFNVDSDEDNGSGYSTGTGVYTARTAGVHEFFVRVALAEIDNLMVNGFLEIVVSSPAQTVRIWEGNPYALKGTTLVVLHGNDAIFMDAAATAFVQVNVSGGAGNTADIYGGAERLTRLRVRLRA